MDASYTAIQHRPRSFLLPLEVLRNPSAVQRFFSATRLHLVLLLMHYVQVSFIPGFRDAAFLKKSSDLVGWPMDFNIENGINGFRDQLSLLRVSPLTSFVHVKFCRPPVAWLTLERGTASVNGALCAVRCCSAAVFAVPLSLVQALIVRFGQRCPKLHILGARLLAFFL